MIERRFGPLFVTTKPKDKIEICKGAIVKVLDKHTICHITLDVKKGERFISDVRWYFFEEINEESHPWHDKIRFHLDPETDKLRKKPRICPEELHGLTFICNQKEKEETPQTKTENLNSSSDT